MMKKLYGIWAIRSSRSVFGHAESWTKHYDKRLEFTNLAAAEATAKALNARGTSNISYQAREISQ